MPRCVATAPGSGYGPQVELHASTNNDFEKPGNAADREHPEHDAATIVKMKDERAVAGGAAWEQKRSEIVRAAASLFDSQGYAQTTVDQIARAANLQKASLYHYCDSKADLLVQIHDDFMELLFTKLRRTQSTNATPEEKLRGVIHDIVSLMATHHAYVRSLFEHYRETPEAERRRITKLRREYEDAVIQLVEEGLEDGSLNAQVSPYYSAMTLFGAVNWSYQWFPRAGGDIDAVAEAISQVVFTGLRRPT